VTATTEEWATPSRDSNRWHVLPLFWGIPRQGVFTVALQLLQLHPGNASREKRIAPPTSCAACPLLQFWAFLIGGWASGPSSRVIYRHFRFGHCIPSFLAPAPFSLSRPGQLRIANSLVPSKADFLPSFCNIFHVLFHFPFVCVLFCALLSAPFVFIFKFANPLLKGLFFFRIIYFFFRHQHVDVAFCVSGWCGGVFKNTCFWAEISNISLVARSFVLILFCVSTKMLQSINGFVWVEKWRAGLYVGVNINFPLKTQLERI